MKVVVDAGCYDWGGHMPSLPTLARTYKPDVLYGFDACSLLREGVGKTAGVRTILRRQAVWTHDGVVPFIDYKLTPQIHHPIGGVGNHVGEGPDVLCFDFARWLREIAATYDRIIVKLDIEGAEVPVLEHVIAEEADLLIDELLVEWHGDDSPLARLRCPVKAWWM